MLLSCVDRASVDQALSVLERLEAVADAIATTGLNVQVRVSINAEVVVTDLERDE